MDVERFGIIINTVMLLIYSDWDFHDPLIGGQSRFDRGVNAPSIAEWKYTATG